MNSDPELIKQVHREVGDRLQREQVRRRNEGQPPLSGAGDAPDHRVH